jgi:hypothetical protein
MEIDQVCFDEIEYLICCETTGCLLLTPRTMAVGHSTETVILDTVGGQCERYHVLPITKTASTILLSWTWQP